MARKHEGKATELGTQLEATKADLERATTLIASMLESRKKGLPEPLVKVLEGKSIFEQLELVDAFLAAQGTQRTATPPTPQAQGGQSDYVQQAIKRQQARATANNPYAAMMKR